MSDKISDKMSDKQNQAIKTGDKQTISKQLAKCPFCGGEAITVEVYNAKENKLYPAVKCFECECRTPMMKTFEQAIKIWNTRKPVERILERLKELYKYNAEQADIYKDGNGAYMREMKEMYMDKANCYGVAMRTVEEEGGIE